MMEGDGWTRDQVPSMVKHELCAINALLTQAIQVLITLHQIRGQTQRWLLHFVHKKTKLRHKMTHLYNKAEKVLRLRSHRFNIDWRKKLHTMRHGYHGKQIQVQNACFNVWIIPQKRREKK